jgi:hypothetical protein
MILTPEQEQRALDLRRAGLTIADIRDALGLDTAAAMAAIQNLCLQRFAKKGYRDIGPGWLPGISRAARNSRAARK